jgi:hypothetical protein
MLTALSPTKIMKQTMRILPGIEQRRFEEKVSVVNTSDEVSGGETRHSFGGKQLASS